MWLISIVHAQNAKPSDIRVRMQSLVDKGVTPGTVTLVIKKGQVLSFEAVGYRASDMAALSQMLLNGGIYKGHRILSRLSVQQMAANQTLGINSAVTHRPVVQGFSWGLAGDPINDFPLTTPGSFGHNGAFGTIFWIDPEEGLIRIFLEQVFGSGNELDIFMAMAAVISQ
ncbi:MAG TPA: serine hydrolase domain-containing protein [Pyrinomonadaceae bacterium]|nr:serine hydrolase domain-containing protein [Pyrinomonadaceae bacterium]